MFRQCYFISWFPREGITKQFRMPVLQKGVAWAQNHGFDVTIIAMEWQHSDYKQFDNVSFVKIPARLPPGHARNVALNMFYRTDDEFCMILDDDTYIEQGDDVIECFRTRKVEGELFTVTDTAEEVWINDPTSWQFVQPRKITSGVFIFRNRTQLFFNTDYKYYGDNLLWGEDLNMLARVVDRGMRGYQIITSATNEARLRRNTPSTWYAGEGFLQSSIHIDTLKRDFSNIDVVDGKMIYSNPAPAYKISKLSGQLS